MGVLERTENALPPLAGLEPTLSYAGMQARFAVYDAERLRALSEDQVREAEARRKRDAWHPDVICARNNMPPLQMGETKEAYVARCKAFQEAQALARTELPGWRLEQAQRIHDEAQRAALEGRPARSLKDDIKCRSKVRKRNAVLSNVPVLRPLPKPIEKPEPIGHEPDDNTSWEAKIA